MSASTARMTVRQRPTSRVERAPVWQVVATALAPAVWGTSYLVTSEMLPPDHPLFAGLARSLPAGLVAVAVARTLPRGRWWFRAFALGALNIGLFFPLLFLAAQRLPGGVAATFGATQPLIVAGLSMPVLGRRPSRRQIGWAVVGGVGVALVVLSPAAALDTSGVAAAAAAAACMAAGVTLTKRWPRPDGVSPMAFAGWQLSAGGLLLLPVTVLAEGAPTGVDATATAGYVWLATAGGLIAYVLWFRGIGLLPVATVAILPLLTPLVAAALGAAVLGQRLTVVQLAGFVLALTAVAASSLSSRRSDLLVAAPTPAPAPTPTPTPTPTGGSR